MELISQRPKMAQLEAKIKICKFLSQRRGLLLETLTFIPTFIRLPYNSLMEEENFSYQEHPSYCDNRIIILQSVFHRVKINLEAISIKQQLYRSLVAVDKKLEIGNLVMKWTPQIKPGMCKKFTKKLIFIYNPLTTLQKWNGYIATTFLRFRIKRYFQLG